MLTVQVWQDSYASTQLGSSPLQPLMLLPVSCELGNTHLMAHCQLWPALPLSMHHLAMLLEAHAASCLAAAESLWFFINLQSLQAPCLAHATGSSFLQIPFPTVAMK